MSNGNSSSPDKLQRVSGCAETHGRQPETIEVEELDEQARVLNAPPVPNGYVFPGSYSGLFGTFFEVVQMAGGCLFDEPWHPVFDRTAVEWTLTFLNRLCRRHGPTGFAVLYGLPPIKKY